MVIEQGLIRVLFDNDLPGQQAGRLIISVLRDVGIIGCAADFQ